MRPCNFQNLISFQKTLRALTFKISYLKGYVDTVQREVSQKGVFCPIP